MAAVRIIPVKSRSERRRFITFPYEHYRDHPHWVPPLQTDQAKALDPAKNPFFEHGTASLFIAERDGKTVGRVAAIISGMHLAKYEDATGYFGFFESIEDASVAQALLDAACGWLRQQGLKAVRGPVNPTINDTAGLLVDGFDRPPSILMPYNPPSYAGYLEDYGFSRAMTMWAFYVHEAYIQQEKLRRGSEIVMARNPGLTIRPLDMDRFWEDARIALQVYNAAWSGNWGSVPMTEREFEHLAKDLKQIIEADMVYFLEMNGRPVAFSVTIPNLNRALKHVPNGKLFPLGLPKLLAYAKLGAIYECRMPLMGVLPEFHGKGFHAPLIYETIRVGRGKGYQACEMSWVLDGNAPLVNALEKLGGTRDKEYAMYEMAL